LKSITSGDDARIVIRKGTGNVEKPEELEETD
jgi:hypothetical protein